MDLQGRSTLILSLAIAAVALGLGWAAFLRKGHPDPSPTPLPPSAVGGTPDPAPAADPRPAPIPTPPASPIPADPVLRQWVLSIRSRHRQGLEGAQSALLTRESEYGEKLRTLAKEDSDPRVRAFTINLLGRMKSRPAEEFFIDRLADPEQYPRISALAALEQAGGAACLPAVDRLASSDPVPEVRAAAARTAKAVRSR
jgi:hypothetical protein